MDDVAALKREVEWLRVLCNVKTDALNAEIRAKQALLWELDRLRSGKPEVAPEPIPERRSGETGDFCSICRGYHGHEVIHYAE